MSQSINATTPRGHHIIRCHHLNKVKPRPEPFMHVSIRISFNLILKYFTSFLIVIVSSLVRRSIPCSLLKFISSRFKFDAWFAGQTVSSSNWQWIPQDLSALICVTGKKTPQRIRWGERTVLPKELCTGTEWVYRLVADAKVAKAKKHPTLLLSAAAALDHRTGFWVLSDCQLPIWVVPQEISESSWIGSSLVPL